MTTQYKQKNHAAVPTTLIVGGTSGLGLELARQIYDGALSDNILSAADIHITGRKDPDEFGMQYHELNIEPCDAKLGEKLDALIADTPYIDHFIYAAGIAQRQLIQDVSDADIDLMNMIGLRVPQMLLGRILRSQHELPGFVAISSVTQSVPRLEEAHYAASKAGLRMFAESASKNPRVKKTMVAAPAGMQTPFWRNHSSVNAQPFLSAIQVANDILCLYVEKPFVYKEIVIGRSPYSINVIHDR
jgi:NAD(P)-dependent dehydrogenase (short-subunit alcohol dehydrogenase family)